MTDYRWGPCSECDQPVAVKKAGLCSKHYQRGRQPRRQAPWGWRGGDDRYLRVKALVEAGASLNEIQRTTGMDSRTVKRWFPDRAEWPVGGGGDAWIVRQVNQDLQRMDDYGNLSARRSHN